MHAQIRNVISRLEFSTGTVLVELSAGEQTPLGRLLNLLYYQTNLCEVIDRDCRFGYPHNGGSHTFTFRGPRGDAVAMLELIKETLAEKFALQGEEAQVNSELSFVSQEILAGRKM